MAIGAGAAGNDFLGEWEQPMGRRKVSWAVVLRNKGDKMCYVKWNRLQEI